MTRTKPDDDETNVSTLRDLLLPFTRGLVSNWAHAGRKEAGIALAYFVGHGAESSRLIGTMSKIAKKVCSVLKCLLFMVSRPHCPYLD